MGDISESIAIYERLRRNKYRISVEDGTEFSLRFEERYYHHLAGFQHIEDIRRIQIPPYGTRRFYQELNKHRIAEKEIYDSKQYSVISERIERFSDIEEIMRPGNAKIIVDYDRNIAESKIRAKYFLYKREGSAFEGNVVYSALFIGHNEINAEYYPVTFVVERSVMFLRDQKFLNCTISIE